MCRGKRETRLKGNFQGGPVPYGYKTEGRKLVIDEDEAEAVRFIFDQSSKGVFVHNIIQAL